MSDVVKLAGPVPLIGHENKRMQFQSFQQALDDLCNRAAGSGIPPQAISETLVLAGLRGLSHISAMSAVGTIASALQEGAKKPDLETPEGRAEALTGAPAGA